MTKRMFALLLVFLFLTSGVGVMAAAVDSDESSVRTEGLQPPPQGAAVAVQANKIQKEIARLELIGPNGGDAFIPGAIYQLKWRYSGLAGTRIRINLLKDGKFFQEISPAVPTGVNGIGVFKWPIANQIEQSDKYRIELQSLDYPGIKDQSDGDFAIRGWVTISEPAISSVWAPGTPVAIRWNSGGYPGNQAKITLLENDKQVAVIDESANLSSSVKTWIVPENLKHADDYRVQIQSVEKPVVKSVSKEFVIRGHLALQQPHSGAVTIDMGCKIFWKADGVGPTIKIMLLREGVVVSTIAASVSASKQEYLWDAKAAPGKDYKIRIVSNTQPQFADESDNTFELRTFAQMMEEGMNKK